jgi:glycerophosphoryl diester phosphodiesterase
MIIIGHRGAAGLAAENTISSFKKAEELGVDMIEMDLRADKKGRIILSHDPDPLKEYPSAVELSDALAVIKKPVNLEVKEPGFEAKLLETIKNFPFEVLISSFKPQVIKKIRALNRDISLGSLIDPDWNKYFYYVLILGRYLKVYSIHPHYSLVTKRRMWWMKKFGFQVYPFVVNNQEAFQKMKAFDVNGVFTDYPNIVKK